MTSVIHLVKMFSFNIRPQFFFFLTSYLFENKIYHDLCRQSRFLIVLRVLESARQCLRAFGDLIH